MRWPSTVAVIVIALAGAPSAARGADDGPLIDPEVRAVARGGTLRVLVELRAPRDDAAAIRAAQDEVVGGLAGTGARVARRYATAPLIALEIDGAALARLEAMPTLVARVRADAIIRPNDGRAPHR
ncbi:MAG: hypothetical protein DME04_08550 [Candidatus Rokuibacteriota bacterium]|nr:MAG: hypothetical protein DME04_08550 [Candidatus Rokubacteria bacterium]